MSGHAVDPHLEDTLEALADAGLEEVEVYAKRGRSRRLELGIGGRSASFHQERGWAVRASTGRASLFACGTGQLDPVGPWPEPDGHPIRLPDPDAAGAAAPWSEPSDLDTPLVGETEGLRLLAGVEEALDEEMPRARLLSAFLEDGSSESELANHRGVRATWRRRVAVLRAEAAEGGHRVTVEMAEREARRFGPGRVASRLADRLAVAGAGPPDGFTGRDRGDFLLAPPVGARLLAALTPLLVGPEATERAEALRDRRGRLGSAHVTVIDDGRRPGGVLACGVDGEGLPTRAVTLVEEGSFRQPLLSWSQARGREGRPSGCARRAGFRDIPRPAPSHLHLAPRGDVPAAELLAELARGYYLLDVTAPPRLDLAAGTFRAPVLGFAVQGGRATGPVSGVWLTGSLRTLLHGIQETARDLSFFPFDGMVGAPTLRVSGLELRARG